MPQGRSSNKDLFIYLFNRKGILKVLKGRRLWLNEALEEIIIVTSIEQIQ